MPARIWFEYEGPDGLRAPVTQALRSVVDPMLQVNVVEAGLIQRVRVADGQVHVRMTGSSPSSPCLQLISEDVEAEVFDHLHGRMHARVELVWGPTQRPERKLVCLPRRA